MNKHEFNYSTLDKILHHVAFGTNWLPKVLAELDTDLHKIESDQLAVPDPVYITGLPRAGTTLILNLLYQTEEFASFTYRDMPFVYSPVLWSKVNAFSKKEHELVNRAHDDGMQIGYDSPEAFDEVLWLKSLSKQYVRQDSLEEVLPGSLPVEFKTEYQSAINRLLFSRKKADANRRYLAKNNSLISRLNALTTTLPDSKVIICFRDPASHVQSLLKQHQRFTELHGEDEFSRKYMKWIGHYDFGLNFKPISYGKDNPRDRSTPEYWYQYWIDVYSAVKSNKNTNVVWLAHERLLENPAGILQELAEFVNLRSPEKLGEQAEEIRSRTKPVSREYNSGDLQGQAYSLYSELLKQSI